MDGGRQRRLRRPVAGLRAHLSAIDRAGDRPGDWRKTSRAARAGHVRTARRVPAAGPVQQPAHPHQQ